MKYIFMQECFIVRPNNIVPVKTRYNFSIEHSFMEKLQWFESHNITVSKPHDDIFSQKSLILVYGTILRLSQY